jgi:predicted CXXCH cytochrome family protein
MKTHLSKTTLKIFSQLSVILLYISIPLLCLSIENSECIDCHSDESLYRSEENDINLSRIRKHLYLDEEKFNMSVHHQNDVACTDCHVEIEELNYDDDIPHAVNLKPVCCSTCHDQEGESFVKSVHMEARGKGITMRCYACHDYHYVTHLESASVAERENTFCLKCHNPYQSHEWLPQKKAHFDFTECTVCHSPDVPHHIHLNLLDLVKNKYLTGDEIIKILGFEFEEFMPFFDKNKNNLIDVDEFDALVLILRQKNVRAQFHAELVAELEPTVHNVKKEGAIRECKICHSPDSSVFNAVTIVLTRKDGTASHFNVSRDVLYGFHTNNFSALGATRIKLLDMIGVGMILGGICGAIIHLLIRIFTIPLRKRKK